MTDTFISEDTFPEKPVIEEDKNPLSKSIVSMLLFMGAFYIFFDKDINFIFLLVGVLLIHELGHFAAMKHYNYADVKMLFIPLLGAFVSGSKQNTSQKQKAIILLAGPIPGIIIGCIVFLFSNGNDNLLSTASVFIFLNIFNLIPLTPFDGGSLIDTLFFNAKDKLQNLFTLLSVIGLIFIAYHLNSYIFLIVPFFLIMRIVNQTKIKTIKTNLDNKGIIYNKPYEELSNKEYWLIREEVIMNIPVFKKVETNTYRTSKHEKQIVENVKSLADNKPEQDLSFKAKMLFLFIWILFFIAPILGYLVIMVE